MLMKLASDSAKENPRKFKIVTEFLDRTKHILTHGIGELVIAIEYIRVDG